MNQQRGMSSEHFPPNLLNERAKPFIQSLFGLKLLDIQQVVLIPLSLLQALSHIQMWHPYRNDILCEVTFPAGENSSVSLL